jgi:acetylornithine deacetylase
MDRLMFDLHETIAARTGEMIELLGDLVAIPSVSGQEKALVEYVREYARRQGLECDLWQADEDELLRFGPLPPKFIPLAGRPTLVIRLPGAGEGPSLLFNAHSDVVGAPDAARWQFGPWSGRVHEGRLFGRGACDTKGPLVSALWAIAALKDMRQPLAGDVLLELIPGEEDCVGLGTLTSVARGWSGDGVVVLEPTRGLPCPASRGGLRFEIACLGQAVHGTVKWLGRDALAHVPRVLAVLKELESRWNDRQADPLFDEHPLMRPITPDSIHGGQWQGMICDRCVCAGYLELLPGDDLDAWAALFANTVLDELLRAGGKREDFSVQIVERYHGHSTHIDSELCQAAAQAAGVEKWSGFNSGCEAGLRARLLGTPTLVWGPGDLAQAHAVDEFVDLRQVAETAEQFARLATIFCGVQQ